MKFVEQWGNPWKVQYGERIFFCKVVQADVRLVNFDFSRNAVSARL